MNQSRSNGAASSVAENADGEPARPAKKKARARGAAPVIPVAIQTLIPDSVTGVSLYLPPTLADSDYRLYCGPDFPLSGADLDNLKQRGLTRLYVAIDEHKRYQEYLRENLDDFLEQESIPAMQRAGALNEVLRSVLADTFKAGDLPDQLPALQNLGEKTVSIICREDVVLCQMRDVLYHDYHTFTHSANVAYYSTMLAHRIGIRDRDELNAIATGALLHDAGKLSVPTAILTKPGLLDDEERAIIAEHPRLGFRMLSGRPDLSFGQLMMVYQHHERVDGQGYPVRAVGSELHDWGKICAVADVFEALTSNRPYRPGLPFKQATAYMQERSGAAFDKELLACWIAMIEEA